MSHVVRVSILVWLAVSPVVLVTTPPVTAGEPPVIGFHNFDGTETGMGRWPFGDHAVGIDSLVYDPEPWLTERDIRFVDWSTGQFHLTIPRETVFARAGLSRDPKLRPLEQPFVIVVHGRPVTRGRLTSGLSSYLSSGPTIWMELAGHGRTPYVLTIRTSMIHDTLEELGLLKPDPAPR